MRKLYIALMSIFLVACSSFDPESAIEEIKSNEHYSISSNSYDIDNNKAITVEIKKDNKNLIFAYYQEKDKSNNFIMYYNQDSNIPVKQCYIEEPANVASIEKEAYIDYIDKLNKQCEEELKQINLNKKELNQIIIYIFKNIK